MNKKVYTYLPFILGSLLFLSIPVFSSPDFDSGTGLLSLAPFQKSFFTYALLLIFFYLNYLYLIPRFYFSKKHLVFVLLVATCYCVVTMLPSLIFQDMGMRYGEMRMEPPRMPQPPRDFPQQRFIQHLDWIVLFQFLLVFFVSLLLRINQRLSDIQSEKLNTEIAYLKAQINPHFLFNTLNSLHALALTKSNDAPEAIVRLSSLMRYVVTESSEDYVNLTDEINYVKNYISLQKLRMVDSSNSFSFEVHGTAENKKISPLLLIPFIENAFKYGINPDEDWAISINITITQNNLVLNVKNKKVSVSLPESEKSQQGIKNTLKRLEHLYPGRHEITCRESETDYEVDLKIELI